MLVTSPGVGREVPRPAVWVHRLPWPTAWADRPCPPSPSAPAPSLGLSLSCRQPGFVGGGRGSPAQGHQDSLQPPQGGSRGPGALWWPRAWGAGLHAPTFGSWGQGMGFAVRLASPTPLCTTPDRQRVFGVALAPGLRVLGSTSWRPTTAPPQASFEFQVFPVSIDGPALEVWPRPSGSPSAGRKHALLTWPWDASPAPPRTPRRGSAVSPAPSLLLPTSQGQVCSVCR